MNTEQSFTTTRWILIVAGAIGAGIILAFTVIGSAHYDAGLVGAGQDAHAYWNAVRVPPYNSNAGDFGAYLYSPAFLQAFHPILTMPWDSFLTLWAGLMMMTLLALTGPVLFVFALPLAFLEIWGGNIHLLLALSVVAGFRWSGTWAFPLLTKITPGVGLLWFAARKEWRHLAIALATTAAIVAVSYVLNPYLWRSWIDLLFREAGGTASAGQIPIPLWVRLPIAGALAIYAGRRDLKWLLPVVVLIAMPVLWWSSLSVLVGCVALERERIEKRVVATVAGVLTSLRESVTEPAGDLLPEPEV